MALAPSIFRVCASTIKKDSVERGPIPEIIHGRWTHEQDALPYTRRTIWIGRDNTTPVIIFRDFNVDICKSNKQWFT